VSAASLFHFTDQSVIKAKTFMKVAGLDVRPA
jgi:imidazole glycerol phosphate synthase subunit HisF